MDRWAGKVAMVTGASFGIGAAITRALVERGLKVVGVARRIDRLRDLAATLTDAPGELHPVRCNICSEEDILRTFKAVGEALGPIHVLVNNACLARQTSLTEGDTDDWRRIFDVNIIALCICTREAVKIMKRYGIPGHIIHINPASGVFVSAPNTAEASSPTAATPSVFPASRMAVNTLADALRQELRHHGTKIKVSCISPGMVQVKAPDDANGETAEEPLELRPEDVSEAVVYVLSTGPSVQVNDVIIRTIGEQ